MRECIILYNLFIHVNSYSTPINGKSRGKIMYKVPFGHHVHAHHWRTLKVRVNLCKVVPHTYYMYQLYTLVYMQICTQDTQEHKPTHTHIHTEGKRGRDMYMYMLHQVKERICGSTDLKKNESILSLPSKVHHSRLAKHLVVVV